MGLDALGRDTRHAARRLAHDWRFTAAAVLILGLGIGANTATFSLINAALFRPSVVDPARLVDIYQTGINGDSLDANSYPAYLDIAEYSDVFSSAAAASIPDAVNYQHDGALRSAIAEYATANYAATLALRPALGRWFTPAEDARGAQAVAVIGYQTWSKKFGRDPSLLGRTIKINSAPVTIVGIGPEGYNGTINIGIVTDFWMPISMLWAPGAPPQILDRRPAEAPFFVKARLRDGVTVAQAQAAMNILGARLASEYPKEDPGKGIRVVASADVRIHPQMDAFLRWFALVLLAVVALVLAVACTNLATLLLVRGTARAKEVSVRLALGATRGQLVRQLLIESVLLALAGGLAGCLTAWWSIRLLGTIDLPIVVDLAVDYRVLGFAIALSFVTGVVFGLAPALKATRIDLVSTLRDEGEFRSTELRWLTLKNALVAFQVAVSVVLLCGTAIFLQMIAASRAQRAGFAVGGVAIVETDTRYAGYPAAEARNAMDELGRRVALVPGVQSVALTRGLPMQISAASLVIEGSTAPPVHAAGTWVGPGYFDALQIGILFGRAIDERDRRDTARVAVINASMAREYFGVVNAVGRRFRLEREDEWFEVVGVARDTGTADLQGDLLDPTRQLFFRSFTQSDLLPTTVVARTSLDAAALAVAMQREVRAVNRDLPIITAATMEQYLEQSLLAPKAVTTLFGGLGALALGLAGVGLYAVVAFAVSRRSREIGIRMALGARSRQVVWAVTRETTAVIGVGIVAGIAASLLAIVAMRAAVSPAPGISLYRPSADPLSLLAIAAFMAAVGLGASLLPAWRAATIDPMTALRRD